MDFQTELDKIMDNFDFQKVQEVMEAVDWWWYHTGGVPNISDLRTTARKLLLQAHTMGSGSGKEYIVATGGFQALYDPRESYLELTFQVSQWSNKNG